ncbi:S-adenosyl-L-methionine-dependent methyltransferase [Aureobasidium namibiae CBS 147.97]|uniref:DNA (cytosine-5-)-methyltransferase n=1 Tax=Aureobasidium namibiae CBS 147.97 TaxID=1043004 RepID=A0A074WIJ6_9PEZI|nr:S-adenosyl-L-methionine-dependent methyltransferase [Aureobasidium namibiae CBS 147.97]KEQ72888.1 S-adenosyl-L-methionine-dependent methyltransferase [Aureobasidium namibiae CBS 147.97]
MIDGDDDIDYLGTTVYDAITVDDVEVDVEDDVHFISERGPVVDNEVRWGAPKPPRPRRTTKRQVRPFVAYEPRIKPVINASFLEGHWITDTFCLVPGLVVELREDPSAPFKCGDFLKITKIYEDLDTHAIYLRGLLYRRSKTLDGMLPKKLNEVYQVLQQNMEDSRSIHMQSLHDVSASLVVRTRCLKHTNTPFPENSFRKLEDMHGQSKDFVLDHAQLTCRWKRLFQYTSHVDLMTGHQQMQAIQRLDYTECDKGLRVPDAVLRAAVPRVESDLTVVDLTAEEAADQGNQQLSKLSSMLNNMHISSTDTAYTFGDYYCGAGGISVGAREAGFKVVYGVDHDPDACATYRLNFPGTRVYEEDVHDNLTARSHETAHVRCVHMSTVCKTVSCAYTVRGRNHDANEATLFTISDILRKATPMVATLEQTFGALHKGKMQLFNAFVWQFTSMNYSVKWALHTLSEYGVPQARKRLIMIAACPGHPLPEFPMPTHAMTPECPVPGLKPSVTIADALRQIRRGTPNHNPDDHTDRNFAPYSPDQLVRGCITTSGGQNNWHPSGKRFLTEREYACLQTFPLDHIFVGNRSSVIRQVGNAVPPAFSQKLFASIRKCFEEVDRMDREHARAIQLDDDEDMDDGRIVVDLT